MNKLPFLILMVVLAGCGEASTPAASNAITPAAAEPDTLLLDAALLDTTPLPPPGAPVTAENYKQALADLEAELAAEQ